MTLYSPAQDAALQGAVVTPFGALQIVLPSATICLLDTSGIVKFGGNTYTGRDPTHGSLYRIEKLTEGTGDQAPALKATFTPQDDAAAVSLAAANMQGSAIRMWIGLVNPATGLPIDDPILLFKGVLDTTTLKGGRNGRSLEMTISSVFERFFLTNDGARLSDTWHRYVWPNELGMSFMTYITHQIYWGTDSPVGVTL